ncbi:MAG: aspartate--tRNA ligase [Flavobacteriaceae bacterium]|nr:aspartate--tRNA ligase [Flavobacteriaceae bacterium]MAR43848.1 aspartate--tRNA ligase [Flavobacteriaceae bacterium]|tara:strand:- start:721 stop:2481 length:1761 start_codon:yes stop_codon:yes gene_type:complete
MFRTSNCGELTISNVGEIVTLAGWVSRIRDKGFVLWIDLRDRYGITQIIFDEKRSSIEFMDKVRKIHREYVIQIKGKVIERESKNPDIKTGDIEILASSLDILNESITPPFTIENNTDGGEELRMKYRYLDIRRPVIQKNLLVRSNLSLEIRKFLVSKQFVEVETPYLIKSTPEGARDFIVPSRMNKGDFYALPQSPQTFKQLLMVSGMDKYFQIVKCFRDEDLRSDRQPEFTQIDCEMSFVSEEDVLNEFEELIKFIIKKFKGIELNSFTRMTYSEAIEKYGSDKPDIRFGMEFGNLTKVGQGKNFKIFDSQEVVLGLSVPNGANFSRKQIDNLIEFSKSHEEGANGIVWVKNDEDGTFKSSVDKFFNSKDFIMWSQILVCKPGDLMLVISGKKTKVYKQLSLLRIEVANRLGLKNNEEFTPVWITDFPLFNWNEEKNGFDSVHHPFTAPKDEDLELLDKNPNLVKSKAYDLVLNGNEIGGGSIRIHDENIQKRIFKILGLSEKESNDQFGFLINSFKYGAPPHGGIAIGFDRLVAILNGQESIRDFIAFPKNNQGKDIMLNSPSPISKEQLEELNLKLNKSKNK